MTNTPPSCRVRKIHACGRSSAVIIPPIAMAHLNAELGNYVYFNLDAPDFIILSKAPTPPDVLHPELFEQPQPAPPQEQTPQQESPPGGDTSPIAE